MEDGLPLPNATHPMDAPIEQAPAAPVVAPTDPSPPQPAVPVHEAAPPQQQQQQQPAAEKASSDTQSEGDAPDGGAQKNIATAEAAAVDAPFPAATRPPSRAGATRRPGGGRGGITLGHLIDEGLLQPGIGVLSVEYKGMTQVADLTDDGVIRCVIGGNEMNFDSPSAFSIYLKRLVNPSRKADDGWKAVKYNGMLLEHYKMEFARMKYGGPPPKAEPPMAKRPRMTSSTLGGGAGAGGGGGGGVAPLVAPPSYPMPPVTIQGTGGGIQVYSNVDEVPIVPRPRRTARPPARLAALGVDDEHSLMPLEAYAPGTQPFSISVHNGAEITMDFHAHLSLHEVIGVLAGTFDPETKTITVEKAIPVKELPTENDSINVEMDPEAEFAARTECQKAGLKLVGWYHSHPTFPTKPSKIDVYNQVLQQHANRVEADGTEPYIAAIVGPFGKHLPDASASITWFQVEHTPGQLPTEGQSPEEAGCIPKELTTTTVFDESKQAELLRAPKNELQQLAKRYAPLPEAQDFDAPWRGGLTRRDKLAESLKKRLGGGGVDEKKIAEFGTSVIVSLMAVWSVYGNKSAAA